MLKISWDSFPFLETPLNSVGDDPKQSREQKLRIYATSTSPKREVKISEKGDYQSLFFRFSSVPTLQRHPSVKTRGILCSGLFQTRHFCIFCLSMPRMQISEGFYGIFEVYKVYSATEQTDQKTEMNKIAKHIQINAFYVQSKSVSRRKISWEISHKPTGTVIGLWALFYYRL